MKGACFAVLLALSAAALPAAAGDGTKFYAERWSMLESVTLTPVAGGVLIDASGSSDGPVTAELTSPDGGTHPLELRGEGGAFELKARAPGGPWAPDGLHVVAFTGSGFDEVPVELQGGALAPGFGAASRSETGAVVFETWSMIRTASVESRGGIDVIEVEAETARTAPVSVSLIAPDGSSATLEIIEPPGGAYSFSAATGGKLWSEDGDYTLLFEQPGSPPYKDDLILPVSGGAVALPVEPGPRDVKVSEARWSIIESASASAESLAVSGSSDRPLEVTMLSPGGVLTPLGAAAPGPDGAFEASFDLSGSVGGPGAYVVQLGGDKLVAYIGMGGSADASRWDLIDTAEALAGEPDVLELAGSTERDAPISVKLVLPGGDERALPPALPSGGAFSASVPAAGWSEDGVYSVVLEQPGSPPYRDAFSVAAESGSVVRVGQPGEVKASGARWTAVESVLVSGGASVSVRGESEADLSARLIAPGGASADLGPVPSEGGRVALDLEASGEPWGRSGTYALILEGEGVRDTVPLIMDGARAAPGFARDGKLERWTVIEEASVSRSGGSDVLFARGGDGGPVRVSVIPPGGPERSLESLPGGPFELDLPVAGEAWSRDGVYAVSFERGEERDLLYLDVRGGSVVPEFGAALWVMAAAGSALAAARLRRRLSGNSAAGSQVL